MSTDVELGAELNADPLWPCFHWEKAFLCLGVVDAAHVSPMQMSYTAWCCSLCPLAAIANPASMNIYPSVTVAFSAYVFNKEVNRCYSGESWSLRVKKQNPNKIARCQSRSGWIVAENKPRIILHIIQNYRTCPSHTDCCSSRAHQTGAYDQHNILLVKMYETSWQEWDAVFF